MNASILPNKNVEQKRLRKRFKDIYVIEEKFVLKMLKENTIGRWIQVCK